MGRKQASYKQAGADWFSGFQTLQEKKVLLLTLGCSSLSKLTLNDYNEIMALFKAGIANM